MRGTWLKESSLKKRLKDVARRCKQAAATPRLQTSTQTQCPLLQLPYELRQQIWHDVLSPGADAEPAHFHVYATEVIDSCTCDPAGGQIRKNRKERRRRGRARKSALLRTCKAIYYEVAHELYHGQHFELAVLAGKARPARVAKKDSLKHINWLDALANTEEPTSNTPKARNVLTRMTSVTLVVQPGPAPKRKPYCKLLSEVLSTLQQSEHLKTLEILVYLHEDTSVDKKRDRNLVRGIIQVLCMLGDDRGQTPAAGGARTWRSDLQITTNDRVFRHDSGTGVGLANCGLAVDRDSIEELKLSWNEIVRAPWRRGTILRHCLLTGWLDYRSYDQAPTTASEKKNAPDNFRDKVDCIVLKSRLVRRWLDDRDYDPAPTTASGKKNARDSILDTVAALSSFRPWWSHVESRWCMFA